MARFPQPPKPIRRHLLKGAVIPAHPLALDSRRKFDERRQRALTRYYMAAGAGGLAVGVHATQFEIHDPKVGLLRPVLELASETIEREQPKRGRPLIRVAGICGATRQAVKEAVLAAELGYHAGLVNLAQMPKASHKKLLEHVRHIGEVIPIFGFYLTPALGGRPLDYRFWREFAEIENVVAIKIATFDRYQTGDAVRAVAESGRRKEIALYTGNDDNIVLDLLTPFQFPGRKRPKTLRIIGGLLGHWAVWTKRASMLLTECHRIAVKQQVPVPAWMLTQAAQVTDSNAAIFDAANGFAGALPGIHEVLRRQGLLRGVWCLNPKAGLSRGQKEEIDRVYAAYPHLNDDPFVEAHRDRWLS